MSRFEQLKYALAKADAWDALVERIRITTGGYTSRPQQSEADVTSAKILRWVGDVMDEEYRAALED